MGYRPLANPPTGKWARRLDQLHRERNWSQTAGFEALREGLRLGPKSRASYVALLNGREPSAEQKLYFIEVFGEEPADAPEPVIQPEVGMADLIAAIDRLTAAVTAQSKDHREGLTGLGDSLGQIYARLGELPGQMRSGRLGLPSGSGQ